MDKALEVYEILLNKKKQRGLEDLLFFNRNIVESDEKRRGLLVPHVHGEWAKRQLGATQPGYVIPHGDYSFYTGIGVEDVPHLRLGFPPHCRRGVLVREVSQGVPQGIQTVGDFKIHELLIPLPF